jgi:hypothetical protein
LLLGKSGRRDDPHLCDSLRGWHNPNQHAAFVYATKRTALAFFADRRIDPPRGVTMFTKTRVSKTMMAAVASEPRQTWSPSLNPSVALPYWTVTATHCMFSGSIPLARARALSVPATTSRTHESQQLNDSLNDKRGFPARSFCKEAQCDIVSSRLSWHWQHSSHSPLVWQQQDSTLGQFRTTQRLSENLSSPLVVRHNRAQRPTLPRVLHDRPQHELTVLHSF